MEKTDGKLPQVSSVAEHDFPDLITKKISRAKQRPRGAKLRDRLSETVGFSDNMGKNPWI